MSEQQTIQSVIQGLGDDLRAYLEAQYHVRDESVLHERKLLLKDGATITGGVVVHFQQHVSCDCCCSIAKESHSRNLEHSWTYPGTANLYCHPWMES